MIALLLLVLSQTPVKVMNNKADATAAAVRCVNASGTAFESCAGGGSSGSWFPDGGVIGIVNQGTSPWVVSLISTTITGSVAVTGTFWQATQPVSGTFWQATQPVSIASMPSTPVTGTFWQATQPVSLTSTTITGTVAATQSGTWTDRVVGNAGAAFDAANNAAAPANVLAVGAEAATQGTTQPTAATAANVRRPVISADGAQYVRLGGPVAWSCFVQAATVTTQCRAAPAAGLRAYVTSVHCSNLAATVQGVDVVFGTGANCVTGITALTHKWQFGTLNTTTNGQTVDANFNNPLVPTAANAICVRPTAATSFGCTLTGFDAP